MLNRQGSERLPTEISEPPQAKEYGLRELVSFLRRRRTSIAAWVIAILLLGCLYLAVTPPEYAATASLVIDTQKIQIFGSGDVSAEASVTNASIETEMQMLGSSKIAEAVVKKLALTKDPAFMDPTPTVIGAAIGEFLGKLLSYLPLGESDPGLRTVQPSAQELDDMETLAAVSMLQGSLAIQRDGLSYVINVTAFAGDPDLAARLANAVTDAYLSDQIVRQVDAARKLSQWLAARIEELRARAYEDSTLTAQEKSASRMTYENFVQRYSQAVQQQSLPESQAVVITKAVPPTGHVSPKSSIVLLASILLGGGLGVAIGIARELLDRAIRTREGLEEATRAPMLGLLPRFRLRRWSRRSFPSSAAAATDSNGRTVSLPPQFTVALDAPFSLFSETLRRIKVAADFGPNGRAGVLGIVSSVPNEGKTTVAGNLAAQLGSTAPSVLLIDADFRNPTLSLALTAEEHPGLLQVLANQTKFEDAIWVAENSSLRFLPTGGDPRGAGGSEMLTSNRMKELLNELRERFDLVIIDLPPMVSLVDVRAAEHVIDGFVFVVEWGVTTRELVTQALRDSGIQPKLIGTVFNKVRLARLKRYDPASSASLKNAYFEAYRMVK